MTNSEYSKTANFKSIESTDDEYFFHIQKWSILQSIFQGYLWQTHVFASFFLTALDNKQLLNIRVRCVTWDAPFALSRKQLP